MHLVGAGLHLADADPFVLFERLLNPGFGGASRHARAANVDPAHAFYLGYEMAKAATALTLGKEYRQDEALDWGFLTLPEESHRLRKAIAAHAARRGAVSDLREADELPAGCRTAARARRRSGLAAAGGAAALLASRQRAARSAAGPLLVPHRRSVRLVHSVPADGGDALGDARPRCSDSPAATSPRPAAVSRRRGGPVQLRPGRAALERVAAAAIRRVRRARAGGRPVRRGAGHSTIVEHRAWLISQGFPETDAEPAAHAGRSSGSSSFKRGSRLPRTAKMHDRRNDCTPSELAAAVSAFPARRA